jgi:hypothetical protein
VLDALGAWLNDYKKRGRMRRAEIILLRHGEKPDDRLKGLGVSADGQADPHSLTPRGWQRAGALVPLLSPNPLLSSRLPIPNKIYASAFREGGGHSRRPEQTMLPVAAKLELIVDLAWALGQEQEFGVTLAAREGTTLVCWQHQGLPGLARAITAPHPLAALPGDWTWPADRYDVIWSLQRAGAEKIWRFRQYSQALLSGDASEPFRFP